jgi:hypothetical protein
MPYLSASEPPALWMMMCDGVLRAFFPVSRDRFSKDDLVGRAKVSREDVMSLVSKAEAEGAASSSLNADLRLEREGRGEIKGKDGKYATLSVEIRAKGKMVDVRKGVSKQVIGDLHPKP